MNIFSRFRELEVLMLVLSDAITLTDISFHYRRPFVRRRKFIYGMYILLFVVFYCLSRDINNNKVTWTMHRWEDSPSRCCYL